MSRVSYLIVPILVSLSGCNDVPQAPEAAEAASTRQSAMQSTDDMSSSVLQLEQFSADALAAPPQVVDCTLINGVQTQCAEIVVKYKPDSLQIGPFCPGNIHTDAGGVWQWDGENPGLYRLDAAFFLMLTEQGFDFYDEDGNTYVGNPGGSMIDGVNNCLEAAAAEQVEMTVHIPLQPVKATAPTQLSTVAQVGIGIDGVPVFADAPSVLDTGHLPALDVCGGHIDPGGWYHWHGTATDIDTSFTHEGIAADCHLEQQPSQLFAYAFDGYPIYGSQDADGTRPDDLDDCNGHTGPTSDATENHYHYHAGEDFPNLPGCLIGVSATTAFATTASGGVGSARGGGRGRPDFGAAAAKLGIDGDTLRDALGEPPPDFAAAAAKLGVSEDVLRAALESSSR